MMDFWKSMAGMVEVELTSAEPGVALQSVNEQNIPVFQVRQVSDLTARFWLRRSDYRELARLAKKRGETLKICQRKGLYWSAKHLVKRPVLVMGMLVLLCMVLYLPTRVLFVRVEGNSAVPSKRILAAAEESGICFWANRREVRSEKMKNALLSAVPELQWAGVNTYGCVAVISVRERTLTESSDEEMGVCSIVAASDGVIGSATVIRGNLLCSPGQAVREGQVLISGYTDCGICIQATRAEGEIYAQTRREMDVITLSQCVKRGEVTQTKQKYSLLIGKKRINLWKDSGIWDASCGRMYEEYYVTLPGGFQLPVAFAVETYTFYESASAEIDQADATQAMSDFAESYLGSQMVAGKILNKTQEFYPEDGIYRLEGRFLCYEMIGRVQREQIGE